MPKVAVVVTPSRASPRDLDGEGVEVDLGVEEPEISVNANLQFCQI